MMKRHVLFAGILALCLASAGCGKNETQDTAPAVTATPAPTPTPSEFKPVDMVEMQQVEETDIKNVIGSASAASSKVVVINDTGADIDTFYVRKTIDNDEEWGEERIKGAFTLKDGEKALYYFDASSFNTGDSTVSTYDIRIGYTDENRSECYFRKLPMKTITQITLCMDESGDSSIPYARYLAGNSKKEISTLNEVKQRLGLLDSEEEEELTPTPEPQETPVPEVSAPPENSDGGSEDAKISAAKDCIGQSLDALIGACGEPGGSDYAEEPETGKTGYHYYDNFTVSTTVDENGNEVVAGVW